MLICGNESGSSGCGVGEDIPDDNCDWDAKDALSKLLQRCMVAEYQNEFEMLISRVTAKSESLLTTIFISGLKVTLQKEVLRERPATLVEAFSLARLIEARRLKWSLQGLLIRFVPSSSNFPKVKKRSGECYALGSERRKKENSEVLCPRERKAEKRKRLLVVAAEGSERDTKDALSKLLQMGTVAEYESEAFSLARVTEARFADQGPATTIATPTSPILTIAAETVAKIKEIENKVGGVGYNKADGAWMPAKRIEDGWHLFDKLGLSKESHWMAKPPETDEESRNPNLLGQVRGRVSGFNEQHQTYSSQRHCQGNQRLLEDILVRWDVYQLSFTPLSNSTVGQMSQSAVWISSLVNLIHYQVYLFKRTILPPQGKNTGNTGNPNTNRVDTMPTTDTTNTTTTTNVAQNIVDENIPQLLDSRRAHKGPYDTRDTKIAALRLKFNAFKSLEGEKKRFYKRSGRVGSVRKPLDKSKETCFTYGKLGGRGRRKEICSSKEVIFTKAGESPSGPAHKITTECDTQDPLPPLPKQIRAEPSGTSNSLISLTNLTTNMVELTLSTTASKRSKKPYDKVSQAYVIKKKTETEPPAVPKSCPDKKADSSTDQLLFTLMEEDLKRYIWYLDSGCSRHMTWVKQYLYRYSKESGPKVVFKDNSSSDTEGYGSVNRNKITFTRVAYVNGLKRNLISINQLCDANFKVLFTKTQGTIFNQNDEVVLIAPRSRDVCVIDMTSYNEESNTCFFAKASPNVNWLWHKRLSHLNFKNINNLAKYNLVSGLPSLTFHKVKNCLACEKKKHHRASFKTKRSFFINKCLHLLYMDLFGHVKPQTISHKKYTLVIINEYSRWKTLNEVSVKELRSDNRTKFRNHKMEEFYDEKGDAINFSENRSFPDDEFLEPRSKVTQCSSNIKYFPYIHAYENITPTGSPIPLESVTLEEPHVFTNEALEEEGWVIVMQEEMNQFKRNKIWTLVPKTHGKTIIGTKWIWKNKMDENGVVIMNKARLVTQAYMGFMVYQIDVKSEFLNGKILEEVYVQQSPGFESSKFSNHVCKLDKALYGLKQAPEHGMKLFQNFLSNTSLSECLSEMPYASPKQFGPDESGVSINETFRGMKGSLTYLKGTSNLDLWYPKGSGFDLKAYSDSDYVGCNLDQKSTLGGCQILGGKLVCWSAKRQSFVAMSSAKAEYVAATGCCAQVLWIKSQLANYDVLYDKADMATKTISFTLSHFEKTLSFDLDTFSSIIGLKPSDDCVPFPPKETVKDGLETLGIVDEEHPSLTSTDLINSSPVKMKYFSPTWKVLMQIESSSFTQATHPQQAKEFVATADATKSLDASESAEEQENQPKTAETEKKIINMGSGTIDMIMDDSDSGLHSMPDDDLLTGFETLDSADKEFQSDHQDTTDNLHTTFVGVLPLSDPLDHLSGLLSEALKESLPNLIQTSIQQSVQRYVEEQLYLIDGQEKNNPVLAQGEQQSRDMDMDYIKGEQLHVLEVANIEQVPPTFKSVNKEKDLVLHESEKNISEESKSEQKTLKEEPSLKKLNLFLPNTTILSQIPIMNPIPLNFVILEHLPDPLVNQMIVGQFNDQLLNTTSSSYSPTPPQELTPPKDESKRKGIASEEPFKDLMPYMEEGWSKPKMINLKSFITLECLLNSEDVMAQVKVMKRLADLKAKKENYRVNSSLEASMRITRGNDPLNVMVYEKFRLKTVGFSEWLKIQALTSKVKSKSNDLLLQSLWAKFTWILSQAKGLGIPPPPELANFRVSDEYKKRKRTENLKEVFVKEDVVVDGMHMNLAHPPGIEGRRGPVIREPDACIFYYNGNFDLVFQKESKFHLATTPQLIRLQSAIIRGTLEAEEMYKLTKLTIKARSDAAEARRIVKDNLDGMGQHNDKFACKLDSLSSLLVQKVPKLESTNLLKCLKKKGLFLSVTRSAYYKRRRSRCRKSEPAPILALKETPPGTAAGDPLAQNVEGPVPKLPGRFLVRQAKKKSDSCDRFM
nr:retrovirus-related Pol polyprotein from transposon TNT 1-94 [Tanacetum cinerariifolium]